MGGEIYFWLLLTVFSLHLLPAAVRKIGGLVRPLPRPETTPNYQKPGLLKLLFGALSLPCVSLKTWSY